MEPEAASVCSAGAKSTSFLSPENGTGEEGRAGRLTNLVVFFRFQGESEFVSGPVQSPAAVMPEEAQNGVGTVNYADSYQKVGQYFQKISNGDFAVDTVFLTADPAGEVMMSYEAPHPRSYYQAQSASNPGGIPPEGNQRFQREMELLENVLRAALPSLPDEVLLDRNNDGKIDNITFIASGSVSSGSQILWPHRWALQREPIAVTDASGEEKLAGDYNLSFSGSHYSGVGMICHELMHTLGFPDLYRNEDPTGGVPVGSWDVMGSTDSTDPQFPLSYLAETYAGWGHVEEISESGVYTLKPLGTDDGSPDGYRIPTENPNEFLIAEYRRSGAAQDVTQDNIPRDGLLLYRVNKVTSSGNYYGSRLGGDEVYVYRPGDTAVNAGTQKLLKDAALSDRWGSDSLGSADASAPAETVLYLSDGSNSRIVISEVKEKAGGSISFQVTLPEAENTVEPGGTYDLSLRDYTVNRPGEYRFTGSTSEHSVTVTGAARGATLILENVRIDLSGTDYRSPILLRRGAEAGLVLEGENELLGGSLAPAVRVCEHAKLTVTGPGTLAATGGDGAAALGGNAFEAAGSLSLSNTEITVSGGGAYAVQGISALLEGGPAPAVGAGSGQSCGDIRLENTALRAASESGAAVCTGLPDAACRGGDLSVQGGSLYADGGLIAGNVLTCEGAELSVQRTAKVDFACLDAAERIVLNSCTADLKAMQGGSAVGSVARMPRIAISGGSLRAFSWEYTLCASQADLDNRVRLSLGSARTEVLYSGAAADGTPLRVQPGMPQEASGRAVLLQGTLETALNAADSFLLEPDGGEREVPAGIRTVAFDVPLDTGVSLTNAGGGMSRVFSVKADGITRVSPLSFSRKPPEYQTLALDGEQVEIRESGEYVLRGDSVECAVVIGAGLEVTLHLDNVSLNAPKGKPAVSAGEGTFLTLVLDRGTENALAGGEGQPAVWMESLLAVSGTGKLTALGGKGAPAVSAKNVSLERGCTVFAAGAGDSAVVRREAEPEASWNDGGNAPVLLLGSFRKALSNNTELFVRGGASVESCRLPSGAGAFLQTLPSAGSRVLTTGASASSPVLECGEAVNVYSDIVLASVDSTVRELDLSKGDLHIAESGSYHITGSTDRYTVSVADGVTATLLLDGVQVRITEERELLGKKALLEVGRNALVTLSLPSFGEESSLINLTAESGCGVAYVPASSRLVVNCGQKLTARPGAAGMLFGAPDGEEAGEIVLRGGEISCDLPEDSSSQTLVGGIRSHVVLDGASLTVTGGPCGAVGGERARVEVLKGGLKLAGGTPSGTLGGYGSAVKIAGGNLTLELAAGCIGVGGGEALIEMSAGEILVGDTSNQYGGMLAGMGGPRSRVRMTGGSLQADCARETGTGGALGGEDASLELSANARVIVLLKQRENSPLAGNVLDRAAVEGGFLDVRLVSAFPAGSRIVLRDAVLGGEAAAVVLPQSHYGFFLYLPEGVYDIAGENESCAGSVQIQNGKTVSLTNVKFDRPAGFWLADASHVYDGASHELKLSGVLPEDASVSYVGNGAVEPGEYPVTATVVHSGGSYELSSVLTVTKAPLIVTEASAEDKAVYDGSREIGGTVTLSGAVGDDTPTASAGFLLDTPDVGERKQVTVAGLKLDPEWESRYELVVPPGALEGLTASVLSKAEARIVWDEDALVQTAGEARLPQVKTEPAGLSCRVALRGLDALPEKAGAYPVEAEVEDPNYRGVASGTLMLGELLDISGDGARITRPGVFILSGMAVRAGIAVDCPASKGRVVLCLRDAEVDLRETGGVPLEVVGAPPEGVTLFLPSGTESFLWGGEGVPALSAHTAEICLAGSGALRVCGGTGAPAVVADGGIRLEGSPRAVFSSSLRDVGTAFSKADFVALPFASPAPEDLKFILEGENYRDAFVLPAGCRTAVVARPAEEGFCGSLRNAAGEVLWSLTPQSAAAAELPFALGDLPEIPLDLAGSGGITLQESGVYRLTGGDAPLEGGIFVEEDVCAVLLMDEQALRYTGTGPFIRGASGSFVTVRCGGMVSVECAVGGFWQSAAGGTIRLESTAAGFGTEPAKARAGGGSLEIVLGPDCTAFSGGTVELGQGCALSVVTAGKGSMAFAEHTRLAGLGGSAELLLSGEDSVGFHGLDADISGSTQISMEITGSGAVGADLSSGSFRASLGENASFTARAYEGAGDCLAGTADSLAGPVLFEASGGFGEAGTVSLESGEYPSWQGGIELPEREDGKRCRSFLMLLPGPGTYSLSCRSEGTEVPLTAEIQASSGSCRVTPEFQVLAEISGLSLEGISCVYDGLEKRLAVQGLPEGASVRYENNGQTLPGEYQVRAAVSRPGYRETLLTARLAIEKRPLRVIVAAEDKEIYDGSAATGGTVRLENAAEGDAPRATADFVFETPDVGENKPVRVTNISLVEDGNHWAWRYSLETGSAKTTASIKKKAEASLSFVEESLVHEYGNVSGASVMTPEGLPVQIFYGSETELPLLPGRYEVMAQVEDRNYQGTLRDTFVVERKLLSLAGIRVPEIREDAESLQITVQDSGAFDAAASGVLPGDEVLLNYTAEYPGRFPGETEAALSGVTLSGGQADRYRLAGSSAVGMGTVQKTSQNQTGGEGTQEPGEEPEPPDQEPLFTDVQGHWAYEDILYAAENGLMTGEGNGEFHPEGTMSRAMLAAVLCRLAGGEDSLPLLEESRYPDVPAGSWYAPYVEWSSEQGLAQGTGSGFRPGDAVSREQIAVFLYRLSEYQNEEASQSSEIREFPDKSRVSDWAAEAVDWAVAAGILGGRTDGRLDPRGSATRAEVAAMVCRYLTAMEIS